MLRRLQHPVLPWLIAAVLGPDPCTGQVLHLKLSGEIECRKQVQDVRSELAQAKERGYEVLAIELNGKGARSDLVLQIVRDVRGCGLRSVALLSSGPGSSVGPGQALIALAADSTYITPRTAIAASASDPKIHREWAPTDTDWDRVQQELVAAAWTSLEARGADPQLAHVLAAPLDAIWAVQRDERLSLTSSPPTTAEEATPIVFASAGGFERLHIDGITAMRLKLVAGTAQSIGEAVSRSQGPAGDRTTREIRSGLHAARQGIVDGLRHATVEVQRTKAHLNVKQRHGGRVITDSDYRKAGEEALDRIRAVDQGLARISARLEEYPELLVEQRPAGSRAIRPPADSIAGQLAAVRKDLEKLRVTASEYATRR